jgi:NAD(P)-dependent dehydrogenase (short-subunit alcohol dehydrogenase family)
MDSVDPLPASARWLPADAFRGQRAFVTGGGTGLGLEISRGLAALGAHVTIASRSAEHHAGFLDEARSKGWSAEAVVLDVREDPEVRARLQEFVDRHGGIDLLVNNAAGNFVCPAERLSHNAWRSVLGIVLDGTFSCSKYAGRHMIAAGGGAMLNVVATYAWTGMPGVVHSASAKAGVLAMTRTLAAEWAQHGVRVNAIAPGPFHSEGAKGNLWPDPAVEQRMRAKVPLGRFGNTDEVAAQCLHLLSGASEYVTGECLVIDGGLSLAPGRMWEPGERLQRRRRAREAGPGAGEDGGSAS